MKKKTIFSIFALILCLSVLSTIEEPKKKPILANEMCMAEEVFEYNTEEDENECETCLMVIGNAKITLTPDIATISACIDNFNEDMEAVKNQSLETLNLVTSKLKESGIEENDISFEYFSLHPTYDFESSHQPLGYNSKTCFSFQIGQLDNISSYIDILTENGVNNICNICYSISNLEEHYSTALSQAFENAKAKASSLLKCDDLKICKIREEYTFSPRALCSEYLNNISPSLVGKVEVEAQVTVQFSCK